jgi:hypothetical protein
MGDESGSVGGGFNMPMNFNMNEYGEEMDPSMNP